MKAPDKIYISHLCDTTIDGEEGHLMAMSFEDNGGEKFIRKDALLKWLENKVSLSYGVATDALVEVIDKISSL